MACFLDDCNSLLGSRARESDCVLPSELERGVDSVARRRGVRLTRPAAAAAELYSAANRLRCASIINAELSVFVSESFFCFTTPLPPPPLLLLLVTVARQRAGSSMATAAAVVW